MKDKETDNHSVFSQSNNIKVMKHDFEKAVKECETNADSKD